MSAAPLKTLAGLNNSVHSIKFKARLDNSKIQHSLQRNRKKPLICTSRRQRRKMSIERTSHVTETLCDKANNTIITHSKR